MHADAAMRARRWLSRGLLAFGLACLLVYLAVTVSTWQYQREAKVRVEKMVTMERPPEVQEQLPDVSRLETGEIIGRVDIPRLKLSAAVAEGDDEKTLRKAVGLDPRLRRLAERQDAQWYPRVRRRDRDVDGRPVADLLAPLLRGVGVEDGGQEDRAALSVEVEDLGCVGR